MEYTTLGSTGMEVSRICLGCMSFGSGSDWMLDDEEGAEIIERAIDLGINFFDTANAYSNGESEEILGETLAGYDRDEQVVATKVRFDPGTDHPNASGLSRKTVEQELENSLERLGMDTVDLYQIHRWDEQTPIVETIRALDDAVRRGKIRYLGASSMWAHQFADALHTADRLHAERFQTMQNHYNVVYREEEREMNPLCRNEGVGLIPWGPLAQGYLARPHEELFETVRGDPDQKHNPNPEYRRAGGTEINERVAELAEEKGLTMAQVAIAWLLHKDVVDAPIIGTTSVDHLEAAVEAVDVTLSGSELDYLEEPYEPVPVFGH
ncbi:Predicted oxidoreductase [Halogranum rubrum]|uniref:Predicted oxidoreductase n=1 Tax=Halogranum rubrum TaxID=553466 RepID=A0A1I4HP64_9EURY|nr:aldo/keto reductase [Halogranum rubrum]SFL44029.1 Predicted oxidoreductase [Halogranum rubrum]